jgi:predicted ester cyclase
LRRGWFAAGAIALLCVAACSGVSDGSRVSPAWLTGLLIDRSYDRFEEYFADGARINGSSFAREYLKATADGLHAAFPDLKLEMLEQIRTQDRVVNRFVLEGTNTGSFNTYPATGREIRFTGVAIDKIEDGRIVESWLQIDLWSMAQQLGMTQVAGGGTP